MRFAYICTLINDYKYGKQFDGIRGANRNNAENRL
jgi:hypothetical protein